MLRLRFLPGLIAGLLIGLPLGAMLVLLVVPPRTTEPADSHELDRLTRRLEEADRDKLSLNRQLDEFRTLAERMTASFDQLERRFRALEKSAGGSDVPSPGVPAPTESAADPNSAAAE